MLALLFTIPAYAWNAAGHKAIALIAYSHLAPTTRSQVDGLLAKHPSYAAWTNGVVPEARGRAAFLQASVWPDTIRSDPRFHEDNRTPTPNIPGLSAGAQARHSNWHFINVPFSTDGTPTAPAAEPNVVTAFRMFENFAQMSEVEQVYALPWILHLVGDIHQPLHVMARFTRQHPQGDRGGNLVIFNSGNLHSYWDSRVGTSETDRFLDELTGLIQKRHPQRATVALDVNAWVQEGFALRTQIYAFEGLGTAQSPAQLSDGYAVAARSIALERAGAAGYRLAEFLNQTVK